MSVLDASLAVDVVAGYPGGDVWRDWMAAADLAAPDHLIVECGRTLRRAVLHEGFPARQAADALDRLLDLPIALYSTALFAQDALALRDNFGFDDAIYVVMAQRLGEELASTDQRLIAATRQFTSVPLAAPTTG